MKKVATFDGVHLCLFALRHISEGDEIRYDYGPDDGSMIWRQVCRFSVYVASTKILCVYDCALQT